ncbi:MAG: T9SS type A sorting domain-containing protein [Crocinitomicaceae bacterium]|nr:T9SS type A sorting domain-containing protein [Crocinitomicaceae bacterium]
MKVFNLMALLTVINFSHAQNLVPNPDFETVSSAFCGIASAGDFDNSFDQWISASNSTPDPYFNNINQSCFNFQPNSTYSGPIGIKGSQLPRSGNAMAGGYMYTISMLQQRDYIQVPLTSPLTIGGLYLVEFYVSLADSTEFATSNIGGILSTSAIFQPGDGVYIASPQIEATSVISDDQSWTRIIDTITATDAFAHLTIGNFYDDNSTTLVAHPTNSGAPGTYGSYYFIDDIRVERVYLVETPELKPSKVNIYPNPFLNQLTIHYPNEVDTYSVSVSDASGRMVMEINQAKGNTVIKTDQYQPGMYFVTLSSGSGTVIRKLVK